MNVPAHFSYITRTFRAAGVGYSYQNIKKQGPSDHLRSCLHISFGPSEEINPS